MIETIKKKFPHIYLYTSTNGLLLDEEKMRRIVTAGLDEITFSVDGADARTYARYRQGGDFEKLLGIMRRFVELRNTAGREVPFINWRYILFRWNDGRRQMRQAAKLAKQIGIDRLTWEITDHPPDSYSSRFLPGTRAWEKIYSEIWDSSQIGSALPGKKFLAALSIRFETIAGRVGQPQRIRVLAQNRGGALWRCQSTSGRRLVRLGAQLFSAEWRLIDLNFARAFLPRDLRDGEKEWLEIELPPLANPGAYWLKFDMVAEGIDWFENGGSPVLWRRFGVV